MSDNENERARQSVVNAALRELDAVPGRVRAPEPEPAADYSEALRLLEGPPSAQRAELAATVQMGSVIMPVAEHVQSNHRTRPTGMRPLQPPRVLQTENNQPAPTTRRAGAQGILTRPDSGLVRPVSKDA